jgi:hypothetical protein
MATRNMVNTTNPLNQCSESRPCPKPGSHMTIASHLVIPCHLWHNCGSFFYHSLYLLFLRPYPPQLSCPHSTEHTAESVPRDNSPLRSAPPPPFPTTAGLEGALRRLLRGVSRMATIPRGAGSSVGTAAASFPRAVGPDSTGHGGPLPRPLPSDPDLPFVTAAAI